tara:strand:- start:47 stop:289 length:243 start_codon:yes stop_codon:yes gene_type:complete
MLHVRNAKYLNDYKLWVSFDDGTSGEVDLENRLSGPMFEPLKEKTFFSKVSVDPELETVVWPNGADLAPEFLKRHITSQS